MTPDRISGSVVERLCRACEEWKELALNFEDTSSRLPGQRRTCIDCRLPDKAAANRAYKARWLRNEGAS